MMGTIAYKLQLLRESKADIRSAIIEKGQSVPDTAPLSSYGDKIRAIQTGADTSDATAAAGDIRSGKTAYAAGGKVTGTMPAATQATPSISVSPGGLITASAAQAAGYVSAGTKSANQQLPTQAAQTITPGTAAKTAVASGRYTTGAVTVAGDANLLPENIKAGVSVFGVDGTYSASAPMAHITLHGDIGIKDAAAGLYYASGNELKVLELDRELLIDVPAGSFLFLRLENGSTFELSDGLKNMTDAYTYITQITTVGYKFDATVTLYYSGTGKTANKDCKVLFVTGGGDHTITVKASGGPAPVP